MATTNRFVNNKRVVFSKETIIKSVSIQLVDNFKLLGITLNNKLNFIKHSYLLKKFINRKLFSIKRLFFWLHLFAKNSLNSVL